eukprot:11702714-Ditylum_brightwellii.AAC.1
MADHGNEAFCVALGVIASEDDNQSKPPDINRGIVQLQGAAVVMIQSRDDFQLTHVPCNSIIDSYSDIFKKVIMHKPCDIGTENQKLNPVEKTKQ